MSKFGDSINPNHKTLTIMVGQMDLNEAKSSFVFSHDESNLVIGDGWTWKLKPTMQLSKIYYSQASHYELLHDYEISTSISMPHVLSFE